MMKKVLKTLGCLVLLGIIVAGGLWWYSQTSNPCFQWLSAAVIDMPMLSNAEQCADMTMRLRSEYLFSQGRYSEIRKNELRHY